jgi:Transposase IS116/IS110/IS902 family
VLAGRATTTAHVLPLRRPSQTEPKFLRTIRIISDCVASRSRSHRAPTVLAEAAYLRRLSDHRRFLKFCRSGLATGQSRGLTRLSKRGNAQPRAVFWMAAASPCACVKTVFGPCSNATCEAIQAVPIEGERLTLSWPLRLRVWRTPLSGATNRCFPEVASPSRSDPALGALAARPPRHRFK